MALLFLLFFVCCFFFFRFSPPPPPPPLQRHPFLRRARAVPHCSRCDKTHCSRALHGRARRLALCNHAPGPRAGPHACRWYASSTVRIPRAYCFLPLGWIRKEEYGNSNVFFRHAVMSSFMDPMTKALLESSYTENDVDKHASNLQVNSSRGGGGGGGV